MKNRGIIYGFTNYLSAIKTLLKTPSLIKFAILPALINLIILSVVCYLGFSKYHLLVDMMLPAHNNWWQTILYWLSMVIIPIIFLIILFFTFVSIACIIASPFLELLSSKYLSKLDPNSSYKFEFPFLKTMWEEAKKIIVILLIAIFAFPLNFIPVIGSFIYFFISSLLFAYEFLDYPMSIASWPFKKRYSLLFKNFFTSLGLGIAITATFLIPIIGFICLPVSIIAATKIFNDINQGQKT
jgi:CysZ protein